MSVPRRIWVTRTRPQADATAGRLAAIGLEGVVAPVLIARPRAEIVIDATGVDAIAFTSGHAVRAFAAISPMRDPPVFTVGVTTAAQAAQAGFKRIDPAPAGDARGLAELIAAARPRPTLVLNPTTPEPAADLVALLAERGVKARALMVYETAKVDDAAVPDGIDAILIHSPKAARLAADLVTPALAARLSVFAISEAAAAPLRPLPFARIAVAAFPNEAHLLKLLDG